MGKHDVADDDVAVGKYWEVLIGQRVTVFAGSATEAASLGLQEVEVPAESPSCAVEVRELAL